MPNKISQEKKLTSLLSELLFLVLTVLRLDYELESSDSHSVSGTVTERHFNRDEEQVTLQVERHPYVDIIGNCLCWDTNS